MRTAIICYSYTNNNLMLAGEILTRTGGTLIPIEEKKSRNKFTIFLDVLFNRTPTIKEYLHLDDRFDHYILISPIWGGKIASPLRAFLLKEANKVKSYSFISICGGGQDQRSKIENELTGILHRKPILVVQLALIELCKDHPLDLTNYRVEKADLEYFNDEVYNFTTTVTREFAPVVTA
ncbi:MAG TPA: hypothetical protein VFE50_08890 [Cyclobacteriaceae bacterium]|nr:hypothetical protein [Cyclobacteriaceae bacterium]